MNATSRTTSIVLRSPFLHFLLIGAAIYIVYVMVGAEEIAESPDSIVVSTGQIESFEQSFAARMSRRPTPLELEGMIEQYVRETALYREALAMGLDEDDVIIRRRLSQKLEFLVQDLASLSEPQASELETFFDENAELYREPERMTFTQVFVDPDVRGDTTLDEAQVILGQLEGLEDSFDGAEDLGDRLMLPSHFPERSQAEVAKLFGLEFARSLFELEPGAWHGPVSSGYGVHLVRVHARAQAPLADFDTLRERILQDWMDEKREAFNEAYIANLLGRYDVVIKSAQPADEQVVGADGTP